MVFRRAKADEGPGPPDETAPLADEALAYLDHLYATAVRLTGSPTAAEDLVQDTYLKAVRFAGQFRPGTNLKAWLFTILHNTFLNDRRGAQRNPIEVDSEIVERAAHERAGSTSPDEQLMQSSFSPDVEAALTALPAPFREAVWLRDVEGFSYAEIARMLEIPVGTVMSRLSRGRRQLHAHLTAAGAPIARAAESHS
jgi:RNA polymerase sigma-70 factor (ECF subfamily)